MKKKKRIFPFQREEVLNDIFALLAKKGYWCECAAKFAPLITKCEPITSMSKERVEEIFNSHSFEKEEPLNECFIEWPFSSQENFSEETAKVYASHFQERSTKFQKKQTPKPLIEEGLSDHVFLKLFPDEEATECLERTFQATKYVYETFFDLVSENHHQQTIKPNKDQLTWLRFYAMSAELTKFKEKETWLRSVDSTCLQNTLRHLDKEWSRYFKRFKAQKNKPKIDRKEIDLPVKKFENAFCITSRHVFFDEEKKTLRLPKISGTINVETLFDDRKEDERISSVIVLKGASTWQAKIYFKPVTKVSNNSTSAG